MVNQVSLNRKKHFETFEALDKMVYKYRAHKMKHREAAAILLLAGVDYIEEHPDYPDQFIPKRKT